MEKFLEIHDVNEARFNDGHIKLNPKIENQGEFIPLQIIETGTNTSLLSEIESFWVGMKFKKSNFISQIYLSI